MGGSNASPGLFQLRGEDGQSPARKPIRDAIIRGLDHKGLDLAAVICIPRLGLVGEPGGQDLNLICAVGHDLGRLEELGELGQGLL